MELHKDEIYKKVINLSSLIDSYDAFLFDIWGVLHEGDDLYEDILELINKIEKNKIVRVVSNAPRLKTTAAGNLVKKGINIDPENVFTSGEIARLMLKQSHKYFGITAPRIFHIGGDRNTELLGGLDIEQTDQLTNADLILLSAYRDYGENHTALITLLENAAILNKKILCANPDKEVINLGKLRLCAGYFAKIYEKLGGEVIYTGKPEKIIFDECLKSFDSAGKRILMVGDTFATDIEGSHRCGFDSALVLTGNMGRLMKENIFKDELIGANNICTKQDYLPTYLVNMR